jgi:hypothetical protein
MHTREVQFPNMKNKVSFYVGQTAVDNIAAILRASPTDLWFHAKDTSSCHVIAVVPSGINKKQISTIIKHGACLCKRSTNKLICVKNIDIIYTQRQYVEIDDTKTGRVTIVNDCKMITV